MVSSQDGHHRVLPGEILMSLQFFSKLFYFFRLTIAKLMRQALPMPTLFTEWPCSY